MQKRRAVPKPEAAEVIELKVENEEAVAYGKPQLFKRRRRE